MYTVKLMYLTTISSVVRGLRLSNGILFPIPVTLDVSHADIDRLSIAPGKRLVLRDPRDEGALAIITGKRVLYWIEDRI
jgi:ATP sulfurylase